MTSRRARIADLLTVRCATSGLGKDSPSFWASERAEFDGLVVEAEYAVESRSGEQPRITSFASADTITVFVIGDVDDPRICVGCEHRLRRSRLDQR